MRLYLLQRGTALVMAPLVLIHIAVIYVAVQGGLTAEEILARTRGSFFWGGFYGLFVAAAAVHGAIGLRNVMQELAGRPLRSIDAVCLAFAVLLIVLGFQAVRAVV